jgi:hypothetical protein
MILPETFHDAMPAISVGHDLVNSGGDAGR